LLIGRTHRASTLTHELRVRHLTALDGLVGIGLDCIAGIRYFTHSLISCVSVLWERFKALL
jgi:hypothetical protein